MALNCCQFRSKRRQLLGHVFRRLIATEGKMGFGRLSATGIAGCWIAISVIALPGVSAQEAPQDMLASQIRDQGYRCDKAIGAKRDLKRSRPDEAVWVLRCNNGMYRMRLIPDMAARVERLK
jgi:hypothetical protein